MAPQTAPSPTTARSGAEAPAGDHRVGALAVAVAAGSLDTAIAERSRIERLAHDIFPQAIARVLDRVVPADVHLTLDRIDLDLGAIAPAALDAEAPDALERAFAAAIESALAEAQVAPRPGARIRSPGAAAIEALDVFLSRGTAPGAAPNGFAPKSAFRSAAATPELLVSMLRRHVHDRRAIDRLVLQMPADDLLDVLASADAALIRHYHGDFTRLYRRTSDRAHPRVIDHALWVLTFDFLLREAGSQFNRRAYVAHLVRGMAAQLGLTYPALLALLATALAETRRRRPTRGSLPGLLDDLVADLPPPAGGEALARTPSASSDRDSDSDALIARLRAAAADPPALAALVADMPATRFAEAIARLEPAHAALILAHLDGLAEMHRAATVVALTERGFALQLRVLTLRYLLRDGGSQFNRRSWTQRLLRGLAAAGGVSYGFLIEALDASLTLLRRRMPPGGSLPRAIAELAADLALDRKAQTGADRRDPLVALAARLRRWRADAAAFATCAQGIAPDTLDRLIAMRDPHGAATIRADIAALAALHRQRPVALMTPAAWERALRLHTLTWLVRDDEISFAREAWRRHLSSGLARDTRIASDAVDQLLERVSESAIAVADEREAHARDLTEPLRNAKPSERPKLIRVLARDPAGLDALVRTLDDRGWAEAAAALGAVDAEAILGDLATLARSRIARTATHDATDLSILLRTLALAVLATGPADRSAFRAALLEALARHQGIARSELGDWTDLARMSPPASPDPLALAERYLRSGTPASAQAQLAAAAAAHPAAFAAMLRRLVIAAAGATDVLLDRLLAAMVPHAVLAVLVPDAADDAEARAAQLADSADGIAGGWRRLLDTALRGDSLGTIAGTNPPGHAADREAVLRHWLARRSLPWWAPAGVDAASLAEEVASLPPERLRDLIDSRDPDAVAALLKHAVAPLGEAPRRAFVERIAPWAFAGAPLDTLPPALRNDAELRAVAAVIADAPVDLATLGRPVTVPPAEPAAPPPPQRDDAETMLLAWLAGDGPNPPGGSARLFRLLAALADRGAPALDRALRTGVVRPAARARWAASLPPESLVRVLHRLAPARARTMLALHAAIGAAWRAAAPPALRGDAGRPTLLLLELVADDPMPEPQAIADRLLGGLSTLAPAQSGRLRAEAAKRARAAGDTHLLPALRPVHAPAPARPAAPDPSLAQRSDADAARDTLYVANAGLVLVAPFLPRFFDRIGVLAGDSARIGGTEHASRAVHLLQYLVDQRCDTPEPDLALNKLLAGLPLTTPVARTIVPDAAEIVQCDQLIAGVLQHWDSLRQSSPAALREGFLVRPGRLRRDDRGWQLTVEQKTLDVLLGSVPWGFRTIVHDWMPEPLHVDW